MAHKYSAPSKKVCVVIMCPMIAQKLSKYYGLYTQLDASHYYQAFSWGMVQSQGHFTRTYCC